MQPNRKADLDRYYSTPAPVVYQTVRRIPREERPVDDHGPVRVIVRDGKPAYEVRNA
jgi:hypothetical protein